ncbi:MAG: 16S rRNA (guanine(966)-N(2))-methyltransferase RsmD [Pseudomonadota bacterium]
MRIVAGVHKGRAIKTPSGRGTRPTSDRAREAVFNVMAHAEWAPALDGARIIDMFAGSGALGLEALSRGGAFCLFVETDPAARGAIRTNIETLSLFGATRIHRRSATDLGTRPAGVGAPFDLVFLDPPYGEALIPPALASLKAGGWLSEKAVAMAETGADEPLDVPGWTILDTRTYGAARVQFLKPAP